MIGLDTNVLVRYIAQDDERQSATANEVMDNLTDESPGYVSVVVLVEVYWVLRRAYKVERSAIVSIFNDLLTAGEIVVEQTETVGWALRKAATGADFADALISRTAEDAGCDHTVTFDQKASKHAGMRLLM